MLRLKRFAWVLCQRCIFFEKNKTGLELHHITTPHVWVVSVSHPYLAMYAFTSSPSHTPCIQVDASHPLLISNSSRQLLLLELSLVYCVALRPVAVEFVLKTPSPLSG